MLELVAPQAPATHQRPPLHLALVIDRSGSMAGPKLETTKECAAFLVRRLAPTDELALVTYDDEVQLLSPLVAVGEAGAALLQVIGGIFSGGSTNLSGGWLKGMEALRATNGAGPRKVLLLTDGLANVGITDPAALVQMTGKAAGAGVGTSTIGFGADFAEELLTQMADAGGGNAHYAPTPDQAPAIFAEEFEGLVSLVAQNVSAEIRPSKDVAMLGVLNEYPAVEVPGGVQVQLGDAYGEERRRIVFELHIPEVASLGVAKVADVEIRYVSVGEEIAQHEVKLPITVNMVSADEAKAAEVDQDVVEEVLILKAARAQEEARKKADEGDFEGAQSLLRTAGAELRAMAPGSKRADELLEQAQMFDRTMPLMSPMAYDPSVAKQMHYGTYQTRRKRPRPTKPKQAELS
jgi:Ca-activated chloride channel homolog